MTDQPAPVAPSGYLASKVIIVTGASQGIGRVAAQAFARAGARVALGARRGDAVAATADEINQDGGSAVGMELDVTDEDSVAKFVAKTVDRFGKLDGLFNNAGRDPTEHGGLADISLAEWQAIHAVKVDGTFLCSKYAIPHMIANGWGSIVNNGSCVSERAPSHVPAPSSSQSAITGMTRSMAAAYGHANVRTNMLATGLILTAERVQGYYAGQADRMKAFSPMRRPGSSEDIAQAAAWLLSDYAAYVNGAIIPVDGGYVAGNYAGGWESRMERLKGKRCVITGGASGMGRAAAELFAREGGMVAILDRDGAALEHTVESIVATDGLASGHGCDVTDEQSVKEATDGAAAAMGGIDVCWANAGTGDSGTVVSTTRAHWDTILAINLTGMFLTAKYVVPHLIDAGGGSLIFTSSSGVLGSTPGVVSNMAAKGGVLGLTRQVATDFLTQRVRVNAICPGPIVTHALISAFEARERASGVAPGSMLKAYAEDHPLGRLGQPEDIANVALFLASDESQWVNAQFINVSGTGH